MYKLITSTIEVNNKILFRNQDNMISVITPNNQILQHQNLFLFLTIIICHFNFLVF